MPDDENPHLPSEEAPADASAAAEGMNTSASDVNLNPPAVNAGADTAGNSMDSKSSTDVPPAVANAASSSASEPTRRSRESTGNNPPPALAATVGTATRVTGDCASADHGLSPYFASLLRGRGVANDNPFGRGGAATTPSHSATMSLLWEGAGAILTAHRARSLSRGDASGACVPMTVNGGDLPLPSSGGGDGRGNGGAAGSLSPADARSYLRAVARNVGALEEAALRTSSSSSSTSAFSSSAGAGSPPGNGGATGRHVADIASAIGVAASFCQSRNDISRSGILPALFHLMERTGTVVSSSSASGSTSSAKKSKKRWGRGAKTPPSLTPSSTPLSHSLPPSAVAPQVFTPFHPEFLQVCLLSSHYRLARSFLLSHPMSRAYHTSPRFRVDPEAFLRYHYCAGLIHTGCDDWDAAWSSFHVCLTAPCQAVSAVTVASRKKGLLCRCLLLEARELDGRNGQGESVGSATVQSRGSEASSRAGGSSKDAVERRLLALPAAVSPAVSRYLTSPSNRVVSGGGGGGRSGGPRAAASATERTFAEGGGEVGASERRHDRSGTSSDFGGNGEGGGAGAPASAEELQQSKNHFGLGRYHDLVSTYVSGNASHYAALLDEMKCLLHSDGNWGLAKRLEGRLAYRAVHRVSAVYSVVGLERVAWELRELRGARAGDGGGISDGAGASVVGTRIAEDSLIGMAARDRADPLVADPLRAKIDHRTGAASFRCDGRFEDCTDEDVSDDDRDDEWMERDLSRRMENCMALAERIRDLDVALETSPKYQQHAMKEMMIKGSGQGGGMKQGQGIADIGHGPIDAFD